MLIKTQCGIKKYNELKLRRGIYNRLRFFFFVSVAIVRDLKK